MVSSRHYILDNSTYAGLSLSVLVVVHDHLVLGRSRSTVLPLVPAAERVEVLLDEACEVFHLEIFAGDR